jgi:hypothetical protein
MSAGPQRTRQREIARGIRAFQQATNIEAENVLVDFHLDGSYSISAKSAAHGAETNPFELEATRLRTQGGQEHEAHTGVAAVSATVVR